MVPESSPAAIDVATTAWLMLLDLSAISVFALVIYFRRHARKDLAVVFTFFNICLFVVITVIQFTQVAAALGFGLFAILSIIRLRSEPFSNREIGYFFGALVLGLLNGVGTPHFALTVGLNVVILATIFVLDHPRAFTTAARRPITLDVVETDAGRLHTLLEERLGARVLTCDVLSIDFVRDSMELEVQYLDAEGAETPTLLLRGTP